ncbi:hypothetical protein FRB99_001805 [Tulasnella sp. 403]|nr:hypothetical protein FRB99_001805 [Tulasnella sp. 403]
MPGLGNGVLLKAYRLVLPFENTLSTYFKYIIRLLILATISLLTLAQFGASAPFTLFGDRKDATSAPAVQEAVDSTKPVAWEASTFDKVAGYLQVPKVKLEQMFSKLFQKEEDIYKPKKDAEKIARKIRNGRGTPEQKALKIVEATGTNAPDEDWELVIRLAKGDGALQDQARKVLVDINAAFLLTIESTLTPLIPPPGPISQRITSSTGSANT